MTIPEDARGESGNSFNQEPLYSGLSADDYRIVELDGLWALFDRRSGQTHLVASPMPELLSIMGDNPKSINDLLADLAQKFELPQGEDHAASLTARLEELAALGLVELVR